MKLLFFCYLFILCSNAFIIKPPNKFLLKPYSFNHNNNFNITPINYYNRKIFYNNNNNNNKLLLKKKNNDDNDDYNNDYNENIKSLSINIIYNLILYSYIYYLITLNY